MDPNGPTDVASADAPDGVRDEPRRAAHRKRDARWSGIPLAASLALVAFSVLFGIYGPRVVDRTTAPLGIPAWELGNAAIERHHERAVGAMHGQGAAITDLGAAEQDIADLLGVAVRLPGEREFPWTIHAPRPITLPGSAKAVQVFFSRPSGVGDHREGLSLVLVPDHEQYVVFSPFGRPLLLPPGDIYPVDPSPDLSTGSSALLWSDGTVVRILTTFSAATLEEAFEAFVTPPSGPTVSAAPASAPERDVRTNETFRADEGDETAR